MSGTSTILGNFDTQDTRGEFVTMTFSPLSAPLRARWRNNGLAADFLGDYVTTFLPAEAWRDEVRHAVAYVANELLENAMKYHERRGDIPICLDLRLANEQITISVRNGVAPGQAQRYRDVVEYLIEGDAADLLAQQLEKNSTGDDAASSGLGLLTMMNDYEARLGWHFEMETPENETSAVTTRAGLSLKPSFGVRS